MTSSTGINQTEAGILAQFFKPWTRAQASVEAGTRPGAEASLIEIRRFSVHVFFGLMIFITLAAVAFGFGVVIELLQSSNIVPPLLLKTLSLTENMILIMDCLLMLIFILRTTYDFMRRL